MMYNQSYFLKQRYISKQVKKAPSWHFLAQRALHKTHTTQMPIRPRAISVGMCVREYESLFPQASALTDVLYPGVKAENK